MHHVHLGTRHFRLAGHPHVLGRPDIEVKYENHTITGLESNSTDFIYFECGDMCGVLPLPHLGFTSIERGINAAVKFIRDLSGNKIEEAELYRDLGEIIELKRRRREIPDYTRN